jgi:hypothetical protein
MAIGSSATTGTQPNDPAGCAQSQLAREWEWLSIRLGLLTAFLITFVFVGYPITSGHDNRDNAMLFVKQLYPDRTLSPADDSTAAVAVVMGLIRSGDNSCARKAIDFAADNEFGYASPYVIERLESEDGALRHSARAFLIRIAGKDDGPSAEAWRAWWQDPTRWVLGFVPVGQRTLECALPVLVAAVGILMWAVRRVRKGRPALSWPLAYIVLLMSWFTTFVIVSRRLVGGFNTCTFGSTTITYHTSHGLVLGLEDARLGGFGLFLLLTVCYLLIPIGIAGLCFFFHRWLRVFGKNGSDSLIQGV